MASVFLSYDREDAGAARTIANSLQKAGHSVWWDRDIKGGAQFSKEIDKALKASDAVVVLWSERSVDSAWVRDEAAAGRDSGRLVPVSLDSTEPPLGFRQFQTIDLSEWNGRNTRALRALVEAVGSFGDREAAADVSKPVQQQPPVRTAARHKVKRYWWLVPFPIVALGGLMIARPWEARPSVPLVAVTAADESSDANALARNLLVKLGSLQSARMNSLRLVGSEHAGDKADLVLQAGGSGSPRLTSASLALLSGRDGTLLWSKDFREDSGSRNDLEQQMAYTGGQVLHCALDASQPNEPAIDQDTLRLFLNACALFAEKYRTDPQSVIPMFERVTDTAPQFEPAWRKLLLAEALYARTERLLGRHTPGDIPKHIEAVRKLNRDVPEIYLAESALLPLNGFAERAARLDKAVRLDPTNPDLLVMRAELNAAVGRNSDAIEDAARAVELNPLSPGLRSHLIADLAYAGRMDDAKQELAKASELWPDSPAIDDARFRFENRYGDAAAALEMVKTGKLRAQHILSPMIETFLLARLEPTEANVRRAISEAAEHASGDARASGDLIQAAGEFHREEELYRLMLRWPAAGLAGFGEVVFRPTLAKFRADPRFMILAARAGLADYWRSSGNWPDFCADPGLPYDCKGEAAKLAL